MTANSRYHQGKDAVINDLQQTKNLSQGSAIQRLSTKILLLLTVFSLLILPGTLSWAEEQEHFGTIRDSVSGKVISGIKLQAEDDSTSSDAKGQFSLTSQMGFVIARAPGYRPQKVPLNSPIEVELQPITPKALYLSYWAAGSRLKRQQLIDLLDAAELNALVIDVKSARGDIAIRSTNPLAIAVNAQKQRTLKDLPQLLEELKARGIYTIGRIVVFKDDRLAKGRPELAIHQLENQIWEDHESLSWSDPFNQEVWDYNTGIAEEAAAMGFDEIQFDYIRFPSKTDLLFSQESNRDSRVAAINGFLASAKERLAPYPVMISANIFGYICWKHKDAKIGQRLIDLGEYVDYLSPMLYPSGFTLGIPGYANPVDHSYQVIAHSLQKAQELSGLPAVRFRPWLQAFRDYAFDRKSFTPDKINAQINASDANGSHGWMLWNAAGRFSLNGLRQQIPIGKLNLADAIQREAQPAYLSGIYSTTSESSQL